LTRKTTKSGVWNEGHSVTAPPSNPRHFRRELESVARDERERWLDAVLGVDELPVDGDDLPAGCVPYLPSSIEVLLRATERAKVSSDDIFVDVGSGLGRAMMMVHLLTGAGAIGLEVQGRLAHLARSKAERLGLSHVATVHGDAELLAKHVTTGSVFYFYCPFSGARLTNTLESIRPLAAVRPLRLCFIDLPCPDLPWLEADPNTRSDEPFVVCHTRLHTQEAARISAINMATNARIAALEAAYA
jgi:hypothetical protein